MAAKPFASSADLGEKEEILEVLGDGVYALTAGGDPNVGAVEGEDFVVALRHGPPRSWPTNGWTSCVSTPTNRSSTWSCRTTTRCGCWGRRCSRCFVQAAA